MSRVGRNPVVIPDGVQLILSDNSVEVKGSRGVLKRTFLSDVTLTQDGGTLIVDRRSNSKFARSYQGTVRQLINNMVKGVTEGFKKELKLVGIGYKAAIKGSDLELSLGYSHGVTVPVVEGLSFSVNGDTITISGIDKELVGEVAAKIKRKRVPDAYKGKGVRYADEKIKLKEVKKSK